MLSQPVADQLAAIASAEHLVSHLYQLTDKWIAEGLTSDAIEPILRFIEAHPELDFGTPGPLVHFVEQFWKSGYEEKLVESVVRRPTRPTVMMLGRIINGNAGDEVETFLAVLKAIAIDPRAAEGAFEVAQIYLERFSNT
jgi:hypothetical protein